MKKRFLQITVIAACSMGSILAYGQKEQQSVLFENYKKNKAQSVLPDFSYAGYKNGEKPIPDGKGYKVFNVTDFGAIPDDTISDREAIQTAIRMANMHGSGIVFFPKGRFLVNEENDIPKSIVSKGSKIIFRGSGSGSGGTELYMKNSLPPANPQQMWTCPPMFLFTSGGADKKIGDVVKDAKIGTFDIRLNTTGTLAPGDWIVLRMLNNDPALINAELAPHAADTSWTYLVKKGVDIKVYYQVKEVANGFVTLTSPLSYDIDSRYKWEVFQFAHAEEVGIENIAFVGNWKDKFVHHRSWKDDSGFTLFNLSRCTDSWIKDCRFTDCSVAAVILQSANVTVLNCSVTGNGGHEAVCSNGSTNVLMANLKDEASQWHSFGSSHGAMNTVIWHCTYPATTCFESHASQPRNTLLDNVTGGLMQNRGGGAIENMPNHMKGLVLWNYIQTNEPVKEFEFWPSGYLYWKIPNPVIAGFQGKGTTFKKEQAGYIESMDQPVAPYSLYEAQLQLRLKKLPDWIQSLKNNL
ncbi:MAG: DUF4955 domain-containing protein [Sphingobacteriia bacterium]|nr:DUF4955 domain-containing protein [Sphingobacteriia bacterium]